MTISRTRTLLACLLLLPAWGSADTLTPLNDNELSNISGQALVEVLKTIGTGGVTGDAGTTFTRIRLGVKATLNANLGKIELGNYDIPVGTYNADNKAQDILINNATLGCVSTGDGACPVADQYFLVSKPYIEFAYKNDGTPQKELVGLRLGAENVDGWLGGDILSLSGDVKGTGCVIICGSGEAHDPRGKDLKIVGIITIAYTSIHRLQLTNTNNFYIGLQKNNLNYPKVGAGAQAVAKPGFWMNLQDGVTINAADVLTGTRMDNCWRAGAAFC